MEAEEIPPERAALGQWLKSMREASGHTQNSAARALETTVTSISRWETGLHPIKVEDFFPQVLLYHAIEQLPILLKKWHAITAGAHVRPLPTSALHPVATVTPSHKRKRRSS